MFCRAVGLRLSLGFLLSLGVIAGASGEQITIDFEEFEAGTIVETVAHPGSDGVIRILGVNPLFSENAAVIFDSAHPGSEDLDLGSPHRDFQVSGDDGSMAGPGRGRGGAKGEPCQNDRPLGKLLIVDDDLKPLTEDGLVEIPNDLGRPGARILVDFAEIGPVTIHGMAVMDVEEPDAVVKFYRVGNLDRRSKPSRKKTLAHYRVHTEDNGAARLFDPDLRNVPEEGCHVTLVRRKHGEPLTPVSGVMSIEVDFFGSGAIARVIYSVDGS